MAKTNARLLTLLQIYLPEAGLENESDIALRYALRANTGELQRNGSARLTELPRADRVDIIIPASLVLFTEVKLPDRKSVV